MTESEQLREEPEGPQPQGMRERSCRSVAGDIQQLSSSQSTQGLADTVAPAKLLGSNSPRSGLGHSEWM